MNLIEKDAKIAFLVGAGCSMEAPSYLPSAREFVRVLINICAPSEEIETILNKEALRYEGIVEIVKKNVDKELTFLNYLDTKKEPNIIHYFLAHNILNYNPVITTNFDYLIEYALMNILPEEKKNNINPIITKEQYSSLNVSNLYDDNEQLLLFKIHGSKKNIITNHETSESLITTLSSLGRDREEGQTFSIEYYKKPVMLKALKDRILIVLGYSGSDDFDIAPFIKELKAYKKIIWIEHDSTKTNTNQMEVFNIKPTKSESTLQSLSKQERFLSELKSDLDIEILLVKASTVHYISDVLWTQLVGTAFKPSFLNMNETNTETTEFKDWIMNLNAYQKISTFTKYHFAEEIYSSLSYWKDGLRVSEKGLEIAKQKHDEKEKAEFLTRISSHLIEESKLEESLNLLLEAKKIYDTLNDYDGIASCLNTIGIILSQMAKYPDSLEYYQKAFDLKDKLNDLDSITVISINLGIARKRVGQYESSLQAFRKALEIVNITGRLDYKAEILKGIGSVYINLNKDDEGLNSFRESFQISQLLGDMQALTIIHEYLGDVYFKLNDYEKGLENYLEGLKIANEIEHLASQSNINLKLANFYDSIDDVKSATQYFQAAMELCEITEDIEIKIQTLSSVAISCYNKGSYSDALDYFNMSLQIARDVGYKSYIISLIHWLAVVHSDMLEYEKSYKYYSEIVNILEKEGDVRRKADYQRLMGDAYYKMTKKAPEAIKILQNAQRLYSQLGDSDMVDEVQNDIDNMQ